MSVIGLCLAVAADVEHYRQLKLHRGVAGEIDAQSGIGTKPRGIRLDIRFVRGAAGDSASKAHVAVALVSNTESVGRWETTDECGVISAGERVIDEVGAGNGGCLGRLRRRLPPRRSRLRNAAGTRCDMEPIWRVAFIECYGTRMARGSAARQDGCRHSESDKKLQR